MSYETAKSLDADPAICQVCNLALRATDAVLTNVHDGERGMVHRACTADGVERWNRANRPHGSPLEAARRDGWRWADAPGKDGRESVSIARYTVVDDDGFVLGEFDEFLAGWTSSWSASTRSPSSTNRLYDRKGQNGAERR